MVLTIYKRARYNGSGMQEGTGSESASMSVSSSIMIDLASGRQAHQKEGAGLTDDFSPGDGRKLDFVSLPGKTLSHQFPVKVPRSRAFSPPGSPLMHPGDHLELTPHPLVVARSSFTLPHHAGLSEKELQGCSIGQVHIFSRRNAEGNLVIGIKAQGSSNPVIVAPGGSREFLLDVNPVAVAIRAWKFQPLVWVPSRIHFTDRAILIGILDQGAIRRTTGLAQ